MIDTLLSRYMKYNVAHIAKIHDRFTQQKAVEDPRQLSSRLATWKDQRQQVRNAGQGPTEEIQLGTLGKVMEKMKDIKAVLRVFANLIASRRLITVKTILICMPCARYIINIIN